ncbi:formyl transferase [Crucibulum laeve]|uniref:methionyl-tRNA formyltransferase n=1 Tax=Crucibulum laeve TaxID=68775 RepID=A0A5C3MA95_9AGAR|nr:formyl transferase [Crucibulum laeve]
MTRNAVYSCQYRHSTLRRLHNSALDSRFKILFMGRDEFSCTVLDQLHAATDVWEEISIATHPDERVGRRGSQLSVSPLKILGESLNIPVHTIPHTKPEFRTWHPPYPYFPPTLPPPRNHLLVTASFGRILPKTMLDLFLPNRRLNVHPSLLPAYRGPAPIQHTILNDEKETGVCVIEMLKKSEGIDTGAIWGCSRMPVPKDVTFEVLRDSLATEGGRLLVSVLRDMRTKKAQQGEQPSNETLNRAPMISIADSIVNFENASAEEIVRRHRAISHQRPLLTHLPSYKNKTLQLHEPEVYHPPSGSPYPHLSTHPGAALFNKSTRSLLIRCAQDSVLSVPVVKQEGKALVSAGDWWNGAKGLQIVHAGVVQLGSTPEGLSYP